VTVTAAAAGTWQLGDLSVNRLGFGAMRLTGGAVFGRGAPGDRDRSISVLRRAIELGVNHIDTAAFYFSPLRSANELINRALAPYPDDLVIAIKVGPGRDPSGARLPWAAPGQLRGQVEENLRQLGEGRETGAADSEPDEVLAIALAHGATPAQVRLAWTLQQGPHVLAIPGTSNPEHLTENVAVGALRLSPGEMDRLRSLRHQGA